MATNQRYCMGCMNPLPSGVDKCELCGYPARGNNPPQYLSVGTVLNDRYLVGRVLSVSGDAALYIGFDTTGHERIHIHEFFPDTLCRRDEDRQVQVLEGKEEQFASCMEEYRNFTRTIARMRDLSAISPIYDIFDANQTVYAVSEMPEGVSLETYLVQNGGRLAWDDARPMFMGLISSLSALHGAGILHLGLSPSNLLVGYDKKLRLRGMALADVRNVGGVLKPHLINGYAAPEQYVSSQECTPATDVYGLAAVLFYALTGQTVPSATSRVKQSSDLYMSADMADEIPKHVLGALVAALQVEPDKRIGDMESFRDHLAATASVEALRIEEEEMEMEAEEETVARPSRKPMWLIVLGVFFILLLAAFLILWKLFPDMFKGSDGNPFFGSQPTLDNPSSSQHEVIAVTYPVDELVGKDYYEVRDTNLTGYMELVLKYQAYSDAPRGTILEQSPAAGTLQEKESKVEIVISAGPEMVEIPEVRGWEQGQAIAYFKALGFKVQTMKVVESAFDRGFVDSVEPAIGEEVRIGDVVILKISDADPVIENPELPEGENEEPTDENGVSDGENE